MTGKLHDPIAHSVHDRLLHIAMARKEDFNAMLARHFTFDGSTLQIAINTTLKRRGRVLPDHLPISLTDGFGKDATKVLQWRAFIRNNRSGEDSSGLLTTVRQVRTFLVPVLIAINTRTAFDAHWPPAGPWRKRNS